MIFNLELIPWYVFTFLSIIFINLYIKETLDWYSFTLVTSVYGAIIKLYKFDFDAIRSNFSIYLSISVVYVTSTLLTLLAISETSLSIVLMTKQLETIIQIIFSFIIFEEKLDRSSYLTFIPTFFGVSTLFLSLENNITFFGLLTLICSNFSCASLTLFYKLYGPKIKTPIYSFYLDINFMSLLFFVPVYFTKTSIQKNSLFHLMDNENNFLILQYLFIGSLFYFISNYYSISYLFHNTKSLHDYFTVVKQLLMQLLCIFIVSTQLTKYQLISIILSDMGILMYSYLKIKRDTMMTSLNSFRNNFLKLKSIIIVQLIMILYFSTSYQTINKSVETYKLSHLESDYQSWNLLNIVNEKDFRRVKCINILKNNIISSYRRYFPKFQRDSMNIISIDIYPDHETLIDHLHRLTEDMLIRELSLKITQRLTDSIDLDKLINSNENYVLLLHSNNNFNSENSNKKALLISEIINRDKERIKITFPQTITNKTLIHFTNNKLIFLAGDKFSFEYAKSNFRSDMEINLVPDVLFLIGSIGPSMRPLYDIVVLLRSDKLSKFMYAEWDKAMVSYRYNYSYLITSWNDYYRYEQFTTMDDVTNNGKIAHQLVNKVLSQGRVIVTDNLEASIYSILLGKPQVIVDNMYDEIKNFREAFYDNIHECDRKYLRFYLANHPKQALYKATKILEKM